jgi:hypothetical protein
VRFATAAVLVLALIAALAGAESAGARRAASTCAAGKVPGKVQMGQVVTLSGTVKPKRRRAVKAQVLSKGHWRAVKTGRSARRTGAFRLKLRLTVGGPVKLRAYAPRTRRLAAAACRPAKITVQAPDGSGSSMPTTMPQPDPSSGAPAPAPMTSGPQPGNSFRAVYALASGQTAVAGQVPAIVNDIKVVNGWYATQTDNSVQPRWVRRKNPDGSLGDPTVTTVRLPHPASAYTGADGIKALVDDLKATAPPASDSEKTVVWIEAGDYACGQTGFGVSVVWESTCDIHPATSDTWPFGGSYLVAHEMTHNFGAVPSCAPHYDGSAHVNDDPRDVLYQGAMARAWNDQQLDPGHDDYYDAGRADCAGIEGSPYWTMTADIGT